jgi:hypothetical protein
MSSPLGFGLRGGLRAGDWVEVRSAEEILATLDSDGCLDALPFMPEMLQFCGRRFQVFKSAHKTCDTIEDWQRIRRMRNAVHLEGLRCGGEAHGGCQAGCLLFWKEAWLTRVPGPESNGDPARALSNPRPPVGSGGPRCDLKALGRATRMVAAAEASTEERYRCQATELVRATAPGRWWDPRQYLKDIASRNVRLRDFVRHGLFAAFNSLRQYPYIRGRAGEKTPSGEALNLQPGEWVRVRSKEEILHTLNRKLRHRGLSFDVEMLPFCGRTFRILRRVERFVDDRTGQMKAPRNTCLILEDVACSGCLSRNRMFCPRSIYPYWHEVWLERVDNVEDRSGTSAPGRGQTHAITNRR